MHNLILILQGGWNDGNLSSNKKDNTETSPKPNGKKTSGNSSVQGDELLTKAINIPSAEPLPQVSSLQFQLQSQNKFFFKDCSRAASSVDLAQPPATPRDSVQKIFIFFRPPKALQDRDNFSLYLFAPNNK